MDEQGRHKSVLGHANIRTADGADDVALGVKRRSAVDAIAAGLHKVDEFGQLMADYLTRLRPPVERLRATLAQISATASGIWQQVLAAVAAFDEYLKMARLTHERFGTVMLELGWPPPGDLAQPFKMEIVQYYDANGPAAAKIWVEAKLLDYYDTDQLKAMVEVWAGKPLLAKRLHIVSAAVEAHLQGKYVLSVPAILPQIEGLIADGFAHNGQMDGTQYKKYAASLLDPGSWLDYPAEINNFVTTQLLTAFKHGAAVGSDLSRHAILHGADTSYATEATSLKAILLFHSVQDAFRIVITSGGECYHLVGCSRVMKPGQKREYITSPFGRQLISRRACRYCLGGQPPEYLLVLHATMHLLEGTRTLNDAPRH